MKDKNHSIKIIFVLAVVVAVAVFLGFRIAELQTSRFDYYLGKVVDQMTYETTVTAKRGDIVDRNGELLATNVTKYRIFISPQDIINAITKAREEKDETMLHVDELIAKGLSEICGVDHDKILEMTKRSGSLDATIVYAAESDMAAKVEAFAKENGLTHMVYVRAHDSRYYIYGDLATHILGFTGTDGNGLYGLEYQYDKYLAGTNGKYITARDSYGNEMPYEYENYVDAQNGYNLNTTIDIKIQSILEEQLAKAYVESGSQAGVCGIVMNVKTGAVYALANYPDYNNNSPWTLGDEYANKLVSSGLPQGETDYNNLSYEYLLRQWSNKALTDLYIPGSTFKIITTSIALESGAVSTQEKFTCTGSIRVADYLIHCHKLRGHGVVTFAEGLKQSCNPVFITVGLRIGTTKFYSYFKNYGYLDRSGLDLPGEGSTIFWDENDFKEIDLATCAFGQNFKISAIRHLVSIASVANGGNLVTPYIVESMTDDDGNVVWQHESSAIRQVISSSVCATVADMLEDGVSGTGGSKNAYVAGYRVAAKTGTSEKIGDNDELKIGSCVAFAPADDPEVAMIIVVDEPTVGSLFGSVVAAPYVSTCLSEILPYLGVEPVYSSEEAKKLEKTVGDYCGSVVYSAEEAITKLGLKCEIIGVGTVVSAQVPEAGSSISIDGGTVYLYVGDNAPENNIRVPDVVGMNAAVAHQMIINSGLNVKASGATNYTSSSEAVVYSQTPAAGSIASRGDIIHINIRYVDLSDDH